MLPEARQRITREGRRLRRCSAAGGGRCAATLNRAVEELAVIDDRYSLIDSVQSSQVLLQSFTPIEGIKGDRAGFLATVHYDVEVLRAADLLADDLVRLPHLRRLLEILTEVGIGADAQNPPYAWNNEDRRGYHDGNPVLAIEMRDLYQ